MYFDKFINDKFIKDNFINDEFIDKCIYKSMGGLFGII